MVQKQIECPFCDTEVSVMIDDVIITWQRKLYEVDKFIYRCGECNQSFTTSESDKLTLGQIPNSIWSKELFNHV